MNIQPVILAGGTGTRLWPLSRSMYPKQFLPLTEEGTLLGNTLKRLQCLAPDQPNMNPLVICNKENRFFVAEHFRESGIDEGDIILEPCGRNTAPALTLAALHILSSGDDAIMLVSPADHMISDIPSFNQSLSVAIDHAGKGHIVTLGITPNYAETGFGYIKLGELINTESGLDFFLDQFVEKPNAEKAQTYLNSGDYLWNSGVFVLKASVWLENIKSFQPEIFKQCQSAYEQMRKDGYFHWIDETAFIACPSDSIDYAVMEKQSKVNAQAPPVVVKLDAGWSDVGSWAAYWDVLDKDDSGNALIGDVVALDTRDSLILSSSRLVSTIGVENLVVVETKDAILVVDKNKSQDVKGLIEHLKKHNREEMNYHREVHRPWGTYDSVDSGDRFVVKRIVVKPGATLSLQMHHHRAEHWIVVKGTARVTRGEDVFLLTENQSTYISIGQKHRLENPGSIPLEIIEVQSGGYLQEDDIVRFEDVYNRENDQ
jgi:mannose-1-phosphate guanylyltransferase / mannose-6-phosphate isomerase